MKYILCSLLFTLSCGIIFSQQKISNGIYTVDQFAGSKQLISGPNRAVVQFNPGFVNEDPENYKPLIIKTDDFFSFESCGQVIVQDQKKDDGLLFLQLNEAAKEKLTAFTRDNVTKNIAVVVNGEALAVYKITTPVTSSLIKIPISNTQSYKQLVKDLKRVCKI